MVKTKMTPKLIITFLHMKRHGRIRETNQAQELLHSVYQIEPNIRNPNRLKTLNLTESQLDQVVTRVKIKMEYRKER